MKTGLVRLCGFLVLTGAAACSSATDLVKPPPPEVPKFTCLDRSATMRLPADLRASLPAFGARVPDDAYVAISQSVPGGFAGVFLEDSTFVLTFVDPGAADRARPQIEQAFESRGVAFFGLDMAKAEFRGARWTFAELDEWFRYIVPKVGGPGSGVSSTDIDERANTVAFGVIDEAARARLEAQLASLNVSCNLVTTVISAYATYAN